MTESEQKLWIKLRAELIVKFHEINNPGKFVGGYALELAVKIATNQLAYDLKANKLRITLEDMLLKSDEDCLALLRGQMKDKLFEVLTTLKPKQYGR